MRTSVAWAALLLAACTNGGHGTSMSTGQPLPDAPTALEWEADEDLQGLKLRLSEGVKPYEAGGEGAAAEPGSITTLDGAATTALVQRLPDLEEQPGDRAAFAKRADSKPPPRTGETVQVAFPPPEAPDVPDVDDGPARILRFAPEGDVPLAPHLSVTFSQPMVAVTTQDRASEVVPVTLTPEPAGQWRWVGTRTILFDPDPRFPMATEYSVALKPDAATASGRAVTGEGFTFATPPVSLRGTWPTHGPHDLEPLLFVGFDQAVAAGVIREFVHLKSGREELAVEPAPSSAIAEDPVVSKLVEGAEPGRYVVLRPTAPLTPATSYTVTLSKGAPSAEGPLPTQADQSFSFRTYDPLAIVDQGCAWGLEGCAPGGNLWLRMNNGVDEDAFDPTAVTIEPAVDDFRVVASGSVLSMFGKTQANTKYTVTLPPALRDTYGQELGKPQSRSFSVGRAHKQLQGPGAEFLTLDPVAPPAYSVYSVNHERLRVRVFKVQPSDLVRVSKWMREARYDGFLAGEPARTKVFDKVIAVDGYVAEEMVETAIDLAPYLDDGKGQLVVWVEPVPQAKERWERIDLLSWVQVTDLALTAYVDQDEVVGWATSLANGAPLADVELSLLGQEGGHTASTDASGVARLGKYAASEVGPHVLMAKRGSDLALLPESVGWWNEYGSWHHSSPSDSLRWFTFDDRAMYRPSETVRVKGWVRRFDHNPGGGLVPLADGPTKLTWTMYDAQGVKLSEGEAELDDAYGFDLALDLPDTPNLGYAYVDLATQDGPVYGWHRHTFQIQEFRRPEFEVTATLDPGPYVLGEHAWVEAHAGYYAGGALPAAPVEWLVRWSQSSYTPPNRSEYRFGRWTPWWGWRGGMPEGQGGAESLSGQTDTLGTHTLQIDFLALNPPVPMSITAEATVIDVNRQRWTASQSTLLHPASTYVGVKPDKAYYAADDAVKLQLIAVDLEGDALADVPIAVKLARLEWTRVGGQWKQVEVDPIEASATSELEAVELALDPPGGGTWKVTARVEDAEGRPNETSFEVWIAGGTDKQAPQRNVEQERLTLVPDKESYAPGDVAELLVQSPFWPAEGALRVQRNGLMDLVRFSLTEPTATVQIPVTDAFVPGVWIDVDVVGSAERRDDDGNPLPDKARRVAYAAGQLELRVPPLAHELDVVVTPRERELAPGGQTTVDVVVRDAAGNPSAGAEVALVVVDDAVLALTGYQLPDPLAVFYAMEGSGVSAYHQRSQVVLANPLAALEQSDVGGVGGLELDGLGYKDMPMAAVMDEDAEFGGEVMTRAAPMAPMEESSARERAPRKAAEASGLLQTVSATTGADRNEGGGSAAPKVEVREDFAALALFAPRVRTDASGRASVPVTLPDSLTRYRVMAVAVAGQTSFGSGESALTARKPVMLRPSPPRFLNFGDHAEVPLVVQNQTDAPLEVDVALRVSNAQMVSAVGAALPTAPVLTAGRRVTVPAHDRREVRFPVATDLAGTARFQALAVAGDATDAAMFSLPVWTPATSEAFATYGEIDAGAIKQPVEAPDDVWPGYGGLEVTTSSTAVQALTDALLYLTQYPYDCSEQIASRMMAVAALRDVLDAFDAEQLPSAAELSRAVDADLQRLQRRQQGNGGWGFYGSTPTEPFLTVHVADSVARAQAAGYTAPGGVVNRMNGYLRNVERHIPSWYSKQARWLIIGHALNVRHQLGDSDLGRARRLLDEAGVDKLPIEAQAWILPVLKAGGDQGRVDQILRHLDNRISETAAGAQIDVGYTDDNDYVLLHSSRRTDGIVLEALIEVVPEHDVIPKLVRGLLGHRVRGRWSTTQENSYILLALNRYFGVYEATTPDFVARAWLGDDYAGEHSFVGRTTERATIEVPMGQLTDPPGSRDLVLQKDGEGRMYYRIGLRYAPRDLKLEAADHGFEVMRAYEAVDDPEDVRRDDDGTWHVKAGARVRGRVTMVAPGRRTHVMLVDPLPAGLEAMNPGLAVTGSLPDDPTADTGPWWWRGTWYQHQNLRDERVEAFTTLLWHGVWEYTYVAVATTPGIFVVPPAKAEEMYHPETFGRSASDRVVVE